MNLRKLLSAIYFFLYIVISALYSFRSSLYISLSFRFRLITDLTAWLTSVSFRFKSLTSVENSETKLVLIYNSRLLFLALLWTRNSYSSQSLKELRIMIVLIAENTGTIVNVILIAVIEVNWAEKRAQIGK